VNIYRKLQALRLDENVPVRLNYEESCDVHHYTDDYIEDAVSETGIAYTLAEAITEGPLYLNGNHILEEMRNDGLLDNYDRGDEAFTDFVAEVIVQKHWDYDWFEYHTERYDYKRGRTTFTLDFEVKAEDLKDHPMAFSGWEAQVETNHGLLTIKD
jgi:hypothetical protein